MNGRASPSQTSGASPSTLGRGPTFQALGLKGAVNEAGRHTGFIAGPSQNRSRGSFSVAGLRGSPMDSGPPVIFSLGHLSKITRAAITSYGRRSSADAVRDYRMFAVRSETVAGASSMPFRESFFAVQQCHQQ